MANPKYEPRSLKEVLSEFSQQKGVRKGMNRVRIEQVWKESMGQYVNRYTRSLRLEGQTLVIEISNATLKQEMQYAHETILEKLNSALEQAPIKKIILR